ncbi:MAG: hypothetical protein GX235_06980 [Clostridiales bacterium]|nr:hypothetical protein [Clostridiales bacterium]
MEHMLASKITAWCSKRNDMSETQAIAVTYGIELIFNSLFKVIGLVLLGVVFGRAWEVILSIGCFSLLRSCAGGVHVKSSLGCFLSMAFVCVLSCVGAEYISYLPVGVMILLSVGIIVLIKLYAPFFTENNPIEDEKIIKKKNIGAVIISVILLTIIWITPIWEMKMIMLMPITLETLSILPCWHGRSKEIKQKDA